ncbi:Interferon-induced transmembrane protein [Mariniphaga anaerophila]|uniref:Interferon-induced transmembrane protein n=1 Tax=Mariniphaga anaerophila TaxID=1484053 RepID=A0A1M5C9X8_9BACT|nr:CD225/dispanin family protein [Mariniphaga anaerophila]SHF51553.1 Interferon-induced transmembrane protein [Mariniphaga anaerophila]
MNEQLEQNSSFNQQAPPPNYLAWAIITTILCCLPFGVVSIIYAAQVNTKWQMGDYEGAKLSSKNAKIWAWVSFGVAIAGVIVWALLVIFGIVAGLGLGALEGINV